MEGQSPALTHLGKQPKTESGMIGYHLPAGLREDEDLPGTSTMFISQYSPDEWAKHIGDDPFWYGELDGIGHRLTNDHTVQIEKSHASVDVRVNHHLSCTTILWSWFTAFFWSNIVS